MVIGTALDIAANSMDVFDDGASGYAQGACQRRTEDAFERHCGCTKDGAKKYSSYASVSVPVITKGALAVATGRETNVIGDTIETAATSAVGTMLEKFNYFGARKYLDVSDEQMEFLSGVAISTVAGQVAGKPFLYAFASSVLSGGLQALAEGKAKDIMPKNFTSRLRRSNSFVQELHRDNVGDDSQTGISIV